MITFFKTIFYTIAILLALGLVLITCFIFSAIFIPFITIAFIICIAYVIATDKDDENNETTNPPFMKNK